MTTPDPSIATSNRRAASMLIHYARADHEGFNAVVSELDTGEDVRNLLLAILALFQSLLPVLMTPSGIALVELVVMDLAHIEVGGPT